MSETLQSISFRTIRDSDRDFIFDSWLKEYRQSAFGRQIESDVYYPHQRKVVAHILTISEVLVACNPEDEDQIYGYAVHRSIGDVKILSWLFVKGTYRGMGLGSVMWEKIGKADIVTHLSRQYNSRYDLIQCKFVSALPEGVVYNPFLDMCGVSHVLA